MSDVALAAAMAILGAAVVSIRKADRSASSSSSTSSSSSSSSSSSFPARGASESEAGLPEVEHEHRFGLAVRSEFLLDGDFVHLNHGSFGTVPKSVMRARRALEEEIEAFPDRFFRQQAQARFERAARIVDEVVGAGPGDCVFVENATAAVNTVLRSLSLGAGDEVIFFETTYNACKNAIFDTCRRSGATAVRLEFEFPVESEAALVRVLEAGLDAHPRAKFVLLDHITSPTAVIMPVDRMVEACRRRGVLVMVDGAHAPGMVPLHLSTTKPDFYCGNLHKWFWAPKGTAFLYTAPEHQARMQSIVISHFWEKGYRARFFMQGTNDQSRYLSFPACVEFADRFGGWATIARHNHTLACWAARYLQRVWGSAGRAQRLLVPLELCGSLAVIETPLDVRAFLDPALGVGPTSSHDEISRAAAADEGLNERIARRVLDASKIMSVFFFRDGSVWCRISAQIYNTKDDFRALGAAVLELARKTAVEA